MTEFHKLVLGLHIVVEMCRPMNIIWVRRNYLGSGTQVEFLEWRCRGAGSMLFYET